MKRSLIGAALFLILVGEPTVSSTSGLFTPAGICMFAVLYISYFLLFDGLVWRYKLTNLRMVLLNFALYSVLITGLLHGEIRDYVLHPHNDLITTLIRIQCSFFPLFVYPLLAKLAPATKPSLKASTTVWIFAGAMLLLSISKHFGIVDLLDTFKVATGIAITFSAGGAIALLVALHSSKQPHPKYTASRLVNLWSWIFLVIGLVPLFPFFLVLIASMVPVSVWLLAQKTFRRSTYAQ